MTQADAKLPAESAANNIIDDEPWLDNSTKVMVLHSMK